MDFFEALRYEARKKAYTPNAEWERANRQAINATIEALKEMMVGEPRMARLYPHGIQKGKPVTLVYGGDMCKTFWRIAESIPGHHGTDGEEVVVMVFRTK